MKQYILLAFLLLFVASKQPSFWAEYGKVFKSSLQGQGEYEVYQFDQLIDHTTFNDQKTFKQKYLMKSKFWKPQNDGPIFFYCGNEGPIEMFYENSYFLNNDLAKQFGALVLYLEHRYFGESMPYGKQSYDKENLKQLTSEQALQDFVYFLKWFQRTNCPTCPIVAFGGSYGGMLASWLRMKYPNVVQGALAASAPIYYFMNREGLDIDVFYKITTDDYRTSSIGDDCPNFIREAYKRIWETDYGTLNSAFKLCTPITNSTGVTNLQNWLTNGFTYMAMTNYPYETHFLKKLPGWPAITACEQMKGYKMEEDKVLFDAVRKAAEVYYNYEQTETCNEIYGDQASDEDMSGWDILACGDMVMPMGCNGKTDMFFDAPWDSESYNKVCQERFGFTPNYNYTLEHYGGITDKDMLSYSNIFFSNGVLDPWSGASPLKSLSRRLPAVYMADSAHHLDLRAPNDNDPESVKEGIRMPIIILNRKKKRIFIYKCHTFRALPQQKKTSQ